MIQANNVFLITLAVITFGFLIKMTLLPFSDELNYDSKIAALLVNLSLLISFALIWGLVLGLKLV